jgi:hypothetical protein
VILLYSITIELDENVSQRELINKYIRDILTGLREEHEVYISLPEEGRDNIVVDRILTMIEGYLWMKMPNDDKDRFYKDIYFSPKEDFVFIKDPAYVYNYR